MSGGKYASESGTFILDIAVEVFGALITCGTNAVAEAGKAVEMQKLIAASRERYDKALAQQRAETDAALADYNDAIAREVRKLEDELRAMGVALPAASGTAADRLRQLTALLAQGKPAAAAKTYCISLQGYAACDALARKLCQTADELIAGDTSCSAAAKAIKARVMALLRARSHDTAAYDALYEELSALLIRAKSESERLAVLRSEFDNELARARALCHITNTLTLYPVFSEATAQQAILRLKAISARQMELIEMLRQNPAMHMTPEAREKSREAVANKICSALIGRGLRLHQVSVVNASRICYYYYNDALLKVVVTDTGIVTFEVVGDPQKKSGFSNYDKKRVIAAMERFQAEYPQLQEALTHDGVVLNLHESVEPCDDIVTYDAPRLLTDAERAANDAAVLAMLRATQQVRYIDGV